MRVTMLGALGLLLWVAAQWAAYAMTGAGHGWLAPFFFSFALAILYPLVLARAGLRRRIPIAFDAAVLLAALVLDLLLLHNMLVSEPRQLAMMWDIAGGLVVAWMALWFGWQAVPVCALLRNSRVLSRLVDRM